MKPLFVVWGKVIKGKSRGKKMGFPTANIPLHKNISDGIYAAKVVFNKKEYIAATFIGASKTFGETERKIEPFLLNFNGNLYNSWITVKIFKKIRENIFFISATELQIQMKKDVNDVQKFFKKF